MLNKIKCFETELNYIQDDCIKSLTKLVINRIPDYFFEIPASSTGKYHPTYALGTGGLLRHTQAACKIAHDVLSLEWFNSNNCDIVNHDYCIAALILHDICKSGYEHQSKFTKHEHPLLASDLVKDVLEVQESYAEFDEDDDYQKRVHSYIINVCNLIETHMGQWNESKYSKTLLPKPLSLAQQLVHMFDYLASRQYIEVKIV